MVSYPADWEVEKIKNLVKVISPSVKIQTKDYLIVGHYPIIDQGQNFISGYTNEISVFPPNEYVIFGEHTCIVKYVDFAFAQGADGIKVLTANINRIIPKYLYYCMSIIKMDASYSRHWLRMREQEIPLPPLNEQIAIADTLAAFDTHITNLTELISKKKAIREGALEELMSGRTRLKGFSGDWEVKTLGEIVTIVQGGTPSTYNSAYWRGNIIWVTPSDITKLHSMYISDSERKITHAGLIHSSASIVPAGAILLCSRATIGELAIATQPMTTNQGFKNLICKENVNNVFLAYLLMTLKNTMIKLARGTTFLELSKANLQSITISLPPLNEQIAIADTLTALDSEIQALTSERDKISQIRDGAMNDLLTGKVRLINGK